MRTAADMVRDSRTFAIDDPARTWRLLLVTLALVAATFVAICATGSWLVRLPLAVLLALLYVRLFAFYHDLMHGSVLRRSRLGGTLAHIVGTYLLAVPSVWRETHDFHHAHNSKLLGSSVGSYPVASVAMWRAMTPHQRRAYRLARHPLTLLLGYLTVFAYGMNVAPFLRAPAKHWSAMVALALHAAAIALVWQYLGASTAIFAVILPLAMSQTLGAYLFYAQHNFVGAEFQSREDWSHLSAALDTSSMFDMSPAMHWFTGNLGYHHVHHLNHRIPFYRLPEAMNAIEELRAPRRTSWSLREIAACMRLAVWDAELHRMIPFSGLPR
jgi:omega-6 fatty acid desaturase (delta-12 desaturase)